MRFPDSTYITVLNSDDRDLVLLVEIYSTAQTSLVPANAAKLYAESEITWNGSTYERQVNQIGDVETYITERFNSVTVTLSNVDQSVGSFLSSTAIKGYRLVIRRISRRLSTVSDVLFVGRLEMPGDIDNVNVSLVAKQDLGNTEVNLPFRTFGPTCQVKDGFKGVECLAGEALGSKSAAYQAAGTCNLSFGQCTTYVNTPAFQGQLYRAMTGNFKVKKKVLGIISKKATKQWSSNNDGAFGKAIPLGVGRTQLELIPMVWADTGQYVAGQAAIGEGPVTAILNLRNVSDGFAATFQFSDTHLGEFGPNAEQTPTGFFASSGIRHSHMAYAEYTIKGNNPDTGDPAPTLVAVILWQQIPAWNGTNFSTVSFSDNPVDAVRWLITERRALGYDTTWLDDAVSGLTADYCNNTLKDTTGGEDLYLSSEMTANGGVDLIRYRSSGVIDTKYWRKILGLDSEYSQQREATYQYATTATPTGLTAATFYRKRFTANFHLVEKVKAVDFIFKKLLPSFRGYLTTNTAGKLQIKAERPQLTQYLRASTSAGATSIAVEDIESWEALDVPTIYALIDVWTSQAETARVTGVSYSTLGNSVTLSTIVTGTITATASGATLSGAAAGSPGTPATGTVTIGGTITAGNLVTITIDGVASQYTINASDTTGTIAAMLTTVINANATINRYIKATWSSGSPTIVTISTKLGTLTLAAGLTYAHTAADEVMHVHYCFSDVAQGALSDGNIMKGSFKWPLASREQPYNQFVCKYTDAKADFADTELIENDFTRQATTNQPIKYEIDGACVDSYFQANTLVVGARYKYGEDKFFVSLAAEGYATLLEVGDVFAAQHANMPGKVNVPFVVEDLRHTSDHRVEIVGRRYKKEMFPDTAAGTTINLETSVTWPTSAPGQPGAITLTTPANGTIRGTFAFAIYQGQQEGQVWVKKAGAGSFIDSGVRVTPDASNNGAFEVSGLPGGSTEVYVIPVNQQGTAGTQSATATITVTGLNGTTFAFSSSTTWTINHNLGYYPRTVLFDSSGNEIDGAVANPTVNQTVVTFNVAQAGSARVY